MAFVKDDHSYTRGVGAIASMDAASPGRRLAAARAEIAMRRSDARFGDLGKYGHAADVNHDGVVSPEEKAAWIAHNPGLRFEQGWGDPPPPWILPRLPGRPAPGAIPGGSGGGRPAPGGFRRPFERIDRDRPRIKSPGSVLDTKTETPEKRPDGGSRGRGGSGGSGSSGGGSSGGGGGSANVGPLEPLPNDPPADEETPTTPSTTPPPKPKAQNNLLLYAALGIGAYWLLVRK